MRTIFIALAVNANTPVSLRRLAEASGHEPSPSVERRIHVAVAALRQDIVAVGGPDEAERLLWRRDGYLLAVDQDELDLDQFTMLFRQGRAALDAEDHRAAAYLLGRALATWRGPADAGNETFGWLRRRLTDLDELRWSAAEGRLVALLTMGQTGLAVTEARALLNADPLHAPWWAALIAGLRDSGEPDAAQQAHDQARQAYVNEYGALPDDVRRLFHAALLPRQLRGSHWINPTIGPRPAYSAPLERRAKKTTKGKKFNDCAPR